MSQYLRSAKTLVTLAVAVATATLIVAGAWLKEANARAAAIVQLEPTSTELDAALRRVSLSPESIAAAGLGGADAAAIVNAAREHLTQYSGDIAAADANYATARRAEDSLRRHIQSGLATQEEINSYAQVNANLQSATNTRASALDALFSAAIASLSTEEKATLATIRANDASWNLPPAYDVISDHTEADWVMLRDALANERIAAAQGEEPDQAMQAVLTDVRSDPDVALARTNLDTNLATVRSAWSQALAE